MPNTPIAFVFDSAEAARAAVRRVEDAHVFLSGFELDADVGRYGVPPAHSGTQCVLLLRLKAAHDEAYVSELVRGAGRLIPVLAAESDCLSIEIEHLRTQNLWRSMMEQTVSMPLAAAMAFHTAHANTRAIVSRKDYDDALGIAASALSRLLPIYTVGAVTRKRVEVRVNLLTHRFALRASQLCAREGEGVIEPLLVKRQDLLFALSLIKRAGLPFSFALLPPEAQAKALEHRDLPPK